MSIATMNLAESVPENISRSAKLQTIIDELIENFSEGEEKNAELLNRFFNQAFFRGGESLINKFADVDPNINFDYIKHEGISLPMLLDNNQLRNFQTCLNKINVGDIEKAFKQEIFDKIKSKIGEGEPYADFDTECAIITSTDKNDSNYETLTSYFKKVTSYLQRKEGDENGIKVKDIISGLIITNEEINKRLPTDEQIPTGVPLKNSSIPRQTKEGFDILLSFEIGRAADCAINITDNVHNKLESIFTNSMPTINTIVGEYDELKYNESKLGTEYEGKLHVFQSTIETILSNGSLSEDEKERQINEIKKQINELRREYYLKYLKTKNSKIGEVLQELYDNNFDYSKLEPSKLEEYLNKVADIRLRMFLNSGTTEAIKANFGYFEEYDKFKDFYKNLINPTKDKIEIFPGIELPIKKEIVGGKHPWLKKIDEFGNKGKSYDTLPIRYTIKKSDIDLLPLNDEDKKNLHDFLTRFKTDGEETEGGRITGDNYIIEGGEIGMLMYLFLTFNRRSIKTEALQETQEKVDELLSQDKKNGGVEHSEKKLTPEQFKENIEKLGPGKFENGSEIWLPMGDSELPGGGYQRMKVKISDIDMNKGTFKGTIFGGELKFGSKLEGKSKEFKMNQEFFDDLDNIVNNTSATKDKIWLLPNPDKSDFNSFREGLKNKLGTCDLTFPTEGLTWDGNKFIQKISEDGKEEDSEVKYFGIPGDDKSTYKIEYNPHRKSFTVLSSFNGEEKGKDGKSEKKRFSYKREMDWNNFLIFFTQKGLTPQTEEESKESLQRQDQEFKIVNGGNWKINWFSLNNLKNGFKDIIGSLKKGIDEYDKNKTKEFKNRVEGPMLRALSKMPLTPSLKYAVGQRQQEIYNEQYNGAWPEIESYLKALQNDEQFADTFDQVPDHVETIYGKSYKKFLTDLFEKKGDTTTEEKRKSAALLLANIQKGSSPYRGLTQYQNKGLRVKVVLGNNHYGQFLRDKQKCIDDLKNAGKDKDQIQTALADGEMNYIINNITGANGALPYFGSHEDRGVPGNKEKTSYKPNPSKILLSDKFANELKSAYQGWFNDSSVNQAYEKISHNNFVQAQADFKRLLKTSRDPGAIANLREMFKLAKTEEQLAQCDKYFLVYMLSGILDICGNKGLRKQAYQRGTTTSFLPGMLAKNTGHSEQVAELLDDFCEEKGYPKFSDNVKSYFHKGDLLKGEMKFENLFSDLDKRGWDKEKMKKFEEYSKVTFRSKDFSDKPLLKKLQTDALNPETENIENSLLDNPLIANRGGLFSNTNVARNRMEFDNGGNFSGKDEDEKQNKKLFWDKIGKDIESMDAGDPNQLKIVLTQFFNFFNMNSPGDKQETLKWIKTAYYRNEKIGEGANKYPENDANGVDMGEIKNWEISTILEYGLKGKVLHDCFGSRKIPTELLYALDKFQEFFKNAFKKQTFRNAKIISEAFGVDDESKIDVLRLGSRDLYDTTIDTDNHLRDKLNDTQRQQGKNLLSGKFINSKIAEIEKTFRQRALPEKYYKAIRDDESERINYRLNN